MAEQEISVGLATAEHLPALHAREPHPLAHFARDHFERQQQGDYYFAVATRGVEPLGFCALDCRPAQLTPELKSLWVYPEFRRQGAGLLLTTYLEEQARSAGFEEVYLRVDPDNVAAIPLYISLDYSPTGDHIPTDYEFVAENGQQQVTRQFDAVYRKSLRIR